MAVSFFDRAYQDYQGVMERFGQGTPLSEEFRADKGLRASLCMHFARFEQSRASLKLERAILLDRIVRPNLEYYSWEDISDLVELDLGNVAYGIESLLNKMGGVRVESSFMTWANASVMHSVARFGELGAARKLHALGHPVDGSTPLLGTPLHIAASKGDTAFIHFLLFRGAKVNAVKKCDSQTPLHIAASEGYHLAVKVLLERGARVQPKDSNGSTPLSIAREGGFVRTYELISSEQLFTRGKKPEGEREILFPQARFLPRNDTVEDLVVHALNQGADPDERDENGYTLMHVTAQEGHLLALRALIDAGGDVNVRTKLVDGKEVEMESPLHLAARHPSPAIEALAEAGADLEATYEGQTPLQLAATIGKARAVRALIALGANFKFSDGRIFREKKPPLLSAIADGHYDVVRTLVLSGEDPNRTFKTYVGNQPALFSVILPPMPFNRALERDPATDTRMARFLIDTGAEVNARAQLSDELGTQTLTPLHEAVRWKKEGIIRVLLARGADVSIMSKPAWNAHHSEQTPVQMARSSSSYRVLTPFCERGLIGMADLEGQAPWRFVAEAVDEGDTSGLVRFYRVVPELYKRRIDEAIVARDDDALLEGLVREGLPGAILQRDDPVVNRVKERLGPHFLGGWLSLMSIFRNEWDPRVI